MITKINWKKEWKADPLVWRKRQEDISKELRGLQKIKLKKKNER